MSNLKTFVVVANEPFLALCCVWRNYKKISNPHVLSDKVRGSQFNAISKFWRCVAVNLAWLDLSSNVLGCCRSWCASLCSNKSQLSILNSHPSFNSKSSLRRVRKKCNKSLVFYQPPLGPLSSLVFFQQKITPILHLVPDKWMIWEKKIFMAAKRCLSHFTTQFLSTIFIVQSQPLWIIWSRRQLSSFFLQISQLIK